MDPKENQFKYDCSSQVDKSLKIFNSNKFFQSLAINKNNSAGFVKFCFLQKSPQIENIPIEIFIRKGENICPFDCSNSGSCVNNICKCDSNKIGAGCSIKAEELIPDQEIELNLEPSSYKFFFVKNVESKKFLNSFKCFCN